MKVRRLRNELGLCFIFELSLIWKQSLRVTTKASL
jgi:hypothetical protein